MVPDEMGGPNAPRSIEEGVLHGFQLRNMEAERLAERAAAEPDGVKRKDIEKEELEYRRESNALGLDVITDWNFDGKDGKPLPIPSTTKEAKKKLGIMEQLPLDVIQLIATEIWNRRPTVPEKTVDFSNGSSVAAGEGS